MISFRHKFIYIHVPKTGGNSIQTALHDFSDDQIVFRKSVGKVANEDGAQGLDVFNPTLGFNSDYHKHAKFSDYAAVMGDEINNFFVVASIRNPFDRLVSWTSFAKGSMINKKINLEDVVFPDDQLSYLEYRGEIVVRNFIRFENLQEDFNKTCDQLNLPRLKLPHKNASLHDHYKFYFDDNLLRVVQERYKKEIDYFGYQYF